MSLFNNNLYVHYIKINKRGIINSRIKCYADMGNNGQSCIKLMKIHETMNNNDVLG